MWMLTRNGASVDNLGVDRDYPAFLVRNDGPVILNVQNNHDTVRYTVRLAQAGSERRDVEPTFR